MKAQNTQVVWWRRGRDYGRPEICNKFNEEFAVKQSLIGESDPLLGKGGDDRTANRNGDDLEGTN